MPRHLPTLRSELRPIGSLSKRIVLTSRRCRIVENATSRASFRTRRGSLPSFVESHRMNSLRRPQPISTDCLCSKHRRIRMRGVSPTPKNDMGTMTPHEIYGLVAPELGRVEEELKGYTRSDISPIS